MAKWLLCFFVLWCTVPLPGQSSTDIKVDFQNTPLSEVLSHLETNYGIYFSYKDEAIKDVRISAIGNGWTLEQAMSQILRQAACALLRDHAQPYVGKRRNGADETQGRFHRIGNDEDDVRHALDFSRGARKFGGVANKTTSTPLAISSL